MTVEQPQEYEERVIATHRVRKTVAGGQIPSFRAVVAVGDTKGNVGVGVGKARQTPDAIRKAGDSARRNMVLIPLADGTITHVTEAKVGGVKVLLRPASKGTGLVAGLGVREVLEVAGVQDVLSKSLGARSRLNRASATFEALKQLRSPEQVARLRGKAAPAEQVIVPAPVVEEPVPSPRGVTVSPAEPAPGSNEKPSEPPT